MANFLKRSSYAAVPGRLRAGSRRRRRNRQSERGRRKVNDPSRAVGATLLPVSSRSGTRTAPDGGVSVSDREDTGTSDAPGAFQGRSIRVYL